MRPVEPDISDEPVIRSLAWATDIDVLPADRSVVRRDGYWAIRSPSNPTHWWGNFLLFDEPPQPGDAERWERLAATEIPEPPRGRHYSFAWDRLDAARGAAESEFGARGYKLEETVALVAVPDGLRPHARADSEVAVRRLDPDGGADAELWDQVIELQVAGRDRDLESEPAHRAFSERRQSDLRALFALGHGGWWVALGPGEQVVGSLGIVVTGPRARYQAVDTAAAHRGRGICSRLVVEAAQRTLADHPGLRSFVICADPDYHAIGIYESLGFLRAERVCAALRPPPGALAATA